MRSRKSKNTGQKNPVNPSLKDKIHSMVDTGLDEWNGEKIPTYQPLVKNNSEKLLSDLVIENRL